MKNLLVVVFILTVQVSFAQNFRGLDKSPMDMAYYPDDFAHDRKFAPQKVGNEAFVRVTYTRTAKKEREIFGKLVPFAKVWRIGANEAPEIKFYKDVTFGGQKVKAGVYTLMAIPNENEWTLILNSDLDVWGAYSYDDKKDVFRAMAKSQKLEEVVENLSIQFKKGEKGEAIMRLAWDKTLVELPIEF